MTRHLVAHDVGLLLDLGGERVVAARRRLVHHHRQRRLQRMREIADVGARAFDDLAVGIDQRVGFARERRDLHWKRAFELFGAAGADRRQPPGNAVERSQAETHLEHGGEQQHRRQHREGRGDRLGEGEDLVVELGRVARDRDQEAALVAEIDVALDQPQPLVLRPLHVALAAAVGIGLAVLVADVRQRAVPERTRRRHLRLGMIEPRDLPVPARQRQLEQRLAQHLAGLFERHLGRRNVGDQRFEIDAEPPVEGALDRGLVEARQDEAGGQQDQDGPDRRRKEQTQRERISAHRAA